MSEILNPYCVQRVCKANRVPAIVPTLKAYYALGDSERKEGRKTYALVIEILNNLIPLDYMGAAEFEFGAVGAALRNMSRFGGPLTIFVLKVEGVPETNHPEAADSVKAYRRDATVYGWCKEGQVGDLEAFVKDEAAGTCTRRLKERTNMQEGLFGRMHRVTGKGGRPIHPVKFDWHPGRVIAWMDIDDLWFIGTDQRQVQALAKILELNVQM
jgi:hypothetical protein